jgi:hypothetical protein
MTLWKQTFCHRCRQKIHPLNGYRKEMIDDGAQQSVRYYHNACWYVLMQARGAKWIEPLSADPDMQPVTRM